MLTSSSHGPAIKQLQRHLNARLEQLDMLAHSAVQVTGVFDGDTLLAVKYLQCLGGLPVDGRVNEPTQRFIEQGISALQTLSIGSKGTAVRAVQRSLMTAQISVVADGKFKQFTELGVKRYQQSFGLVDDGIVGPKTWEKIVRSRLKTIPCIALLPNPYSVSQCDSMIQSHSVEQSALNGQL